MKTLLTALMLCLPLLTAGMMRCQEDSGKKGIPVLIKASDFGAIPNDAKDDTEAFQKMFAAAAQSQGGATITLSPGRYDFFPEKATRRITYASNAVSAPHPERTIALDLQKLNQVTIKGNGAEMLMHGNMSLLAAENCRDLVLENLSFDLARPTISEITVTESGADFWIGKVHADCPYELRNNRITWIGENWRLPHNMTQEYAPDQGIVWRRDDPFAGATVEEVQPGVLKVTTSKPVVRGRVLQFRDTERDQVGVWFNHCSGVTMRDVQLHSLAGFGVLSQFTSDITYTRVKVTPKTGSGRTCASAADIFHFAMCRGKITVKDCLMDGAQDDAINIHGIYFKIVAQPAPNQILVEFGHVETYGFQAFGMGDEIEFAHKTTLLPFGKAKVTKAEVQNERQQLLTLESAAPEGIALGQDAVENLTWTPSVEITGCRVSRIPTRGFLLTTRRPIVVKNNTFERTIMPAILISDDASSWFESGPVRDVIIENNTFNRCGEPVIAIAPENTEYAGPVHQNIRIVGNTFALDSRAVYARSAVGVVVEKNRFLSANAKVTDFVVNGGNAKIKTQSNTTNAKKSN